MASEWTVENLKEYIEKMMVERDKAINIALAAAKEAVAVAEANADKWRMNANEWRGAMNDREKTFLPRSEFETYRDSTQTALGLEKTRADKDEGKGVGLSSTWAYILGGIGAIGGILAIITRFL